MQNKDYVILSPKYDTYVKVFGELEGKTPLIILHGGPGGFMEKRKPDSAKSKITKRSKSKSEKELSEKELSENEKLLAELQYLRMENEYLKKLNALVQKRIARENGKK